MRYTHSGLPCSREWESAPTERILEISTFTGPNALMSEALPSFYRDITWEEQDQGSPEKQCPSLRLWQKREETEKIPEETGRIRTGG